MKRITLFRGGRLSLAALALVTLALSAVALTIDMLVAAVAPSVLEVPSDDPVLSLMRVSLASIPPVLGNAIGFYFSYRSHDPRTLLKFLAPAAGFFLAFMIPPRLGFARRWRLRLVRRRLRPQRCSARRRLAGAA